MRRVLLSALAAATALTGFALASSAPPAGAEGGLIDLKSTTVGRPAAVSPPGALAFYTVTFENKGALPVLGATMTNTTTGGTVLSFTADSTCTRSGNTITCTDALDPAEKKVVEVVVQSPTTLPASIVSSSNVTYNPSLLQPLDLDPANNASQVTTPVQASTVAGSSAFVPEGGTLGFKKHTLTVLDAEVGVVATLQDTPAVATFDCGGVPCHNGLRVTFTDGAQGQQFYGLVEVDVDFGAMEPCRGNGNPDCHPLYFFKPGMSGPQDVPDCGAGVPMPCESSFTKIGHEFHIKVRLDTDDPDLLSPIKSLSTGTT